MYSLLLQSSPLEATRMRWRKMRKNEPWGKGSSLGRGAHPADWYSQHHWLSNWLQQHPHPSWYINHKPQIGTSLMWSHLSTLTCWFERSSKILGRTDAQKIWDLPCPLYFHLIPAPCPSPHQVWGVMTDMSAWVTSGWYLIPNLSHPPKSQWIQSCPGNQSAV